MTSLVLGKWDVCDAIRLWGLLGVGLIVAVGQVVGRGCWGGGSRAEAQATGGGGGVGVWGVVPGLKPRLQVVVLVWVLGGVPGLKPRLQGCVGRRGVAGSAGASPSRGGVGGGEGGGVVNRCLSLLFPPKTPCFPMVYRFREPIRIG